MSRVLASTLLAVSALACQPYAVEPPSRVVLFSLDGNAHWFMDELLERGQAETYATLLREKGFSSPIPLISNFASITPAGFASIYTGAYSNVHGVDAYRVFKLPHSEHDLLETISGFSGDALLIDPIWIVAAAEGKKTIVNQATQSFPMQVEGKEKEEIDRHLTMMDGLQIIGPDALLSFQDLQPQGEVFAFSIQSTEFYLAQRSPETIAVSRTPDMQDAVLMKRGFPSRVHLVIDEGTPKTLRALSPGLRTDPFSAPADPAPSFHPDTDVGEPSLRCYLAWIDGSLGEKHIRLYQSNPTRRLTNRPELFASQPLPPPSVPGGAFSLYRQGAFGRTLAEGGRGEAESLYLDTVLVSIEDTEQFSLWLQDRVGAGRLEIYYFPFPDEALHLWAGYMIPGSPAYSSELAEKFWPIFSRIFDRIALFMKRVIYNESLPAPAAVFQAADHGMEFATQYFYVNSVLEQAGLLARNDDSTIDLSRTSILYLDGSYFLKVNLASYQDGIVEPAQVPEVIDKASRALLAARDPETGEAIVRHLWPAQEWSRVGAGGIRGGEVYLDLASGYYPSPSGSEGVIAAPRGPNDNGVHGALPLQPLLKGALAVTGSSGFQPPPAEAELPEIFAHICALLEITCPQR